MLGVKPMNREQVNSFIEERFDIKAEYPFMKYPSYAVFRRPDNQKWFAVILNVSLHKLGLSDNKNVDILNLKCDPALIGSLRQEPGFLPAYHMNKTNWITIMLDSDISDEKIKWLVEMSFDLTCPKIKPKKINN